jgi:acetoin utilization deacetylase AcuC-like enzyme
MKLRFDLQLALDYCAKTCKLISQVQNIRPLVSWHCFLFPAIMPVALLTHSDCLGHVTPPGHPEQVARLDAVLAALADHHLLRLSAPLCPDDDILRVHPASYVAALRRASPQSGWRSLDPDTHMSSGTLAAAWRAAGAVVTAVDTVMSGVATRAFCAIRPPGHHAERETAMGFCFLGNVAIGAKHAVDHHGLSRVAIVDFDVHHGNGTQDLVESDPRILFISTHQSPLYPGTGERSDTGPHNTILNLPLRMGTGSGAYRRVVSEHILPRVDRFAPEMILISAGFDAHSADPLAGLTLTEGDFGWITRELCVLADRHCAGRVVSSLEGGYDLEALGACVAAHVAALMENA